MIADGTCRRCREGLSYACERWSFFGWGPVWTCGGPVEGGQAELVRVPLADGTLTTVAEEFDDPALDETLLLLSDNMSTAWHGLQQTRAREGRAVVTIGDGAVGLCAIHGAAALGADPIVCLGHHEDRLAIATRLGATATIRVEGEIAAIVDAVRDLTDGEGAPVVIDAVSSPDSLALAQACTRPEGAIACLGLGHLSGPSPVIDWTDQFLRNLTITGGMVPGRRHVPALLGLVAAGRLDLSPVVTHRLPLADATAGYRMMADRREGAVKIALSPG
jgi:threonine dehydrogenase-like Zn-dependent dehydrogenase